MRSADKLAESFSSDERATFATEYIGDATDAAAVFHLIQTEIISIITISCDDNIVSYRNIAIIIRM